MPNSGLRRVLQGAWPMPRKRSAYARLWLVDCPAEPMMTVVPVADVRAVFGGGAG